MVSGTPRRSGTCTMPSDRAYPVGIRPAPAIPMPPSQSSAIVWGAFDAWIAHWRGCARCRLQDWFLPGEVRFLAPREAVSSDRRMLIDGVERPWRPGADVRLLCRSGAAAYRTWVTEASRHEHMVRRPVAEDD